MKIIDAVKVLDAATQPQNIGKLTREDFVLISQALAIIAKLIPKEELEEAEPPAEE